MGGVDGIETVFYFFVDSLAEVLRRELHAGLDELGVLLDGEIRIPVFVVDDPALAFGNHLVAEFFGGEFVSPFAEGAFGEFLDIAFVDEGDGLAFVFERVLDGHAHQALGTGYRDGLDADAGV